MYPLKTRVEVLEEKLHYKFKNPNLLTSALTHSSANINSNERMEFLGDRVLGLVMTDYLYKNFDKEEGYLAKKLNYWVSRVSCAEVARMIGLGDALMLAPSEDDSGGRKKETILGDACEAVIAAIYLDGGFEAAQKTVLHLWSSLIDRPMQITDSKSALQEWSQARNLGLPDYKIIARSGPDHAPIFRVQVFVKTMGHAVGQGTSRRTAEHEAATLLLEQLLNKETKE